MGIMREKKNNFKEGCYASSLRERHLMPIGRHMIPPILKE
jgi:hypothetical protein